MAVDPELQARVAAASGATLDQADDPDLAAAVANAFVAVGIESPAAELAPVAIFAMDDDGIVQSWNRAAETTFGWDRAEIVGNPLSEFFGYADLDPLVRLVQRDDGSAIENVACSTEHRDGHPVHVLVSATRVRPATGASGVVAFATDVTENRESELAIEATNHRWRHVLMNISDMITILDAEGRLKETTGEIADILGYPTETWKGSAGFRFIHPDEQGRAAELWYDLLGDPGGERRDVFRTRHADGHYELIEYRASNLLEDPSINGVVMTTRDVTRQKQAEVLISDEADVLERIARDAPLAETLEAITDLVEFHGDGATSVLLIDADAHELRIGAAGSLPAEIFDIWRHMPWPPEAHGFRLNERSIVEDFATDRRTAHFAERAASFGIAGGFSVPIHSNRDDAVIGLVATHYREPRRPTEHEQQVSEVAADLAAIAIERDRWREELTYQARHDPVTMLPNRAAIREHVNALVEDRAPESALAVMFIDLDRFKVVNDSLGHAAGDLLLHRFAGRLSNLVRPNDFVGHFGADAFVVILADIASRDDVRFVANRLEMALNEPFALEDSEVYVSASIGAAICNDRERADNGDELIQHADAAMFRAKELGRGRLEIFDHAMRRRAGERLRIDRDLRVAIERGELEVHYQPEIDVASGRMVGAEALLRWDHPELGLLLPEDFLGVAEDTGLIISVGSWVVDNALAQASRWRALLGDEDWNLAVNLSGRQLSAPGLVAMIASSLDRHGWPASQLTVELDESVLIDDREATLDVLTELRVLGAKIAIDDFGTGYSSLSYLHRFPVDVVKVDQSFVTALRADGSGSPVVTAIVKMAHALDIVAAAEGVEEPDQLAALRELGCDRAQGFLFSGALPPAKLESFLGEGRRW